MFGINHLHTTSIRKIHKIQKINKWSKFLYPDRDTKIFLFIYVVRELQENFLI